MVEVSDTVLDMYEQIYDTEHHYDDDYEEEFHDNSYHLGICSYDKDLDGWLLASTVKSSTLFQYSFDSISNYLNNYSVIEQGKNVPTDIMHLSFQGQEPFQIFSVIKKTFWLKLIQRTWKKIYAQRKDIVKNNMVNYLHKRSLGITQPSIPTLHGMLSYLKESK